MESPFSLRLFVRHLVEYAVALLRKSVLDSAEGASLLVAKMVALVVVLLIIPVCMVLVAFLVAYSLSDLLGVGITVGVLLTLLLLIAMIVAIRVWYKPLTRPVRNWVKSIFIDVATRCKYPRFEGEKEGDLEDLDLTEEAFDGDEEA